MYRWTIPRADAAAAAAAALSYSPQCTHTSLCNVVRTNEASPGREYRLEEASDQPQ